MIKMTHLIWKPLILTKIPKNSGFNWYPSNNEHELKVKVKDNKVYDKKTNKELIFNSFLDI